MGFSVSFPSSNVAEQVIYVDPNSNKTTVSTALDTLNTRIDTLEDSPVSTQWKIIDTVNTYSALKGDMLAVKNAASIILPNDAEEGDTIYITDYNNTWGSSNLNVESINTIDGQPSPLILDVSLKYGKITLIYNSVDSDWRILVNYLGMETQSFDASSDTTSVNNTNTTVDSE